MPDLSVIIPARNEIFLARTIEDILSNARGDTEVIAVCDGYWPHPPVADHPRVNVVHFSEPVGQRGATNAAARLSTAKYVMKADAHCSFSEGFDRRLTEPYETGEIGQDVTTVPRMYNLHAFDWVCEEGHRRYQGPSGQCEECGRPTLREVVWKRRRRYRTDFARFDGNLRFKYWRSYENRPEARGDIADVMCCVGACWLMPSEWYWRLGGMDEGHGGWGQMGVELSCKSWLGGGRQVVNKRAWFSHMFRTQGGDFSFPYKITGNDQERARRYSRDLWIGDRWEKAVRPFSWLLDKFAPVPDWHEAAEEQER